MEYIFRYDNFKHLQILPPEHGEVDDNYKDCRAILEIDMLNLTGNGQRKIPVRARCNNCLVLCTFWVVFDTKK